MSVTSPDPRMASARSAPRRPMRLSWSDPLFRSIVWQIVIVGIVVGIGWYLVHNTIQNLSARRIATGFGFLDRVAGIPIGSSYRPDENSCSAVFCDESAGQTDGCGNFIDIAESDHSRQ